MNSSSSLAPLPLRLASVHGLSALCAACLSPHPTQPHTFAYTAGAVVVLLQGGHVQRLVDRPAHPAVLRLPLLPDLLQRRRRT